MKVVAEVTTIIITWKVSLEKNFVILKKWYANHKGFMSVTSTRKQCESNTVNYSTGIRIYGICELFTSQNIPHLSYATTKVTNTGMTIGEKRIWLEYSPI